MTALSKTFLVCFYTALSVSAVLAADPTVCEQAVQGKIAWNAAGHTRWASVNIDRLCGSATESEEPARCFEQVMHGGVDAGRASGWTWSSAIDLCAATEDHRATIRCFEQRIATGATPGEAQVSCRSTSLDRTPEGPRIELRDLQPAGESVEIVLPPVSKTLSTTWWTSVTAVDRTRHTSRTSVRPQLGEVAGLQRFSLEFSERDHKIRQIAVLAEDRFANFAFGDEDGEDDFTARASWAVFSDGVAGEVTATGGGRINLPLEPGPANWKLVLTGFEFRRADGTDANVRMLGIRLVPEENVARVWLIDDQGFDFRDIEETVGWTALGGLFLPPLGHVIAGAASAPAAAPSRDFRPYSVKIQYAWVPNDAIILESSASGTVPRAEPIRPPDGAIVLQGFEFAFGNSDHHLATVAVELERDDPRVRFKDQGWDDPMDWSVSYAVLRSDRKR